MEHRKYVGGAAKLTVKGNLDPSSLNIYTNELPAGWHHPDPVKDGYPFWISVDRGKATEEKMDCESIAADGIGGSVIVVRANGRGADGTTARSHTAGAIVEMIWTAADAQAANDHDNADHGVHGLPSGTQFVATAGHQVIEDKDIIAKSLKVEQAGEPPKGVLLGLPGETLNKPIILEPISTVTPFQVGSAHTLTEVDQSRMLEPSGAANTITIPDDATLNVPVGTVIGAVQVAGKIHFLGAAGVTVQSPNGPYSLGAFAVVFMWKRAVNSWLLIGDLTNSST